MKYDRINITFFVFCLLFSRYFERLMFRKMISFIWEKKDSFTRRRCDYSKTNNNHLNKTSVSIHFIQDPTNQAHVVTPSNLVTTHERVKFTSKISDSLDYTHNNHFDVNTHVLWQMGDCISIRIPQIACSDDMSTWHMTKIFMRQKRNVTSNHLIISHSYENDKLQKFM